MLDKLFSKIANISLVVAVLTVCGVFPWNIITISIAIFIVGYLIFRMVISISPIKGLWKELTTPRLIAIGADMPVYEEYDNLWDKYQYRLKYSGTVDGNQVLYKIIYVPIINKIIRRSYILMYGSIPRKVSNPSWMKGITTKEETYIPFPHIIDIYEKMGHKFDIIFDQSDIKYYKVAKQVNSDGFEPISPESYIFAKINEKWELIGSEQINGLFNRLSAIGKMQLNIFNITCSIEN